MTSNLGEVSPVDRTFEALRDLPQCLHVQSYFGGDALTNTMTGAVIVRHREFTGLFKKQLQVSLKMNIPLFEFNHGETKTKQTMHVTLSEPDAVQLLRVWSAQAKALELT